MDNKLINRRGLVKLLKKEGVLRVSPEALESVEKEAEDYLIALSEKMKSKMIINGRRTLIKEDVVNN